MSKVRLDKLLVEKGLAPTREKAQAWIMAGLVRVDEVVAQKSGMRLAPEAVVEVKGKDHPYVSRGGLKLQAGLEGFGLKAQGLTALDIGASTGGFTHCLLLHGAKKVYAVDVGYGQLAWEVRNDPRVVVWERTNIRNLPSEALGEQVDLVVVDVSFISLAKVLGEGVRFLKPGGQLLGLLKPQFEAGRENVGRGGVVKDEEVHQQVLAQVAEAGNKLGLEMEGVLPSPVLGKKSGNQEFLVLWRLS